MPLALGDDPDYHNSVYLEYMSVVMELLELIAFACHDFYF